MLPPRPYLSESETVELLPVAGCCLEAPGREFRPTGPQMRSWIRAWIVSPRGSLLKDIHARIHGRIHERILGPLGPNSRPESAADSTARVHGSSPRPKAAQSKAGQSKAAQSKAGQSKASQSKAGQSKAAAQTKADERSPKQSMPT